MKKLSVLLTSILLISLVFTGTAMGAENYKIGISIPSADHGWTGGLVWWAEQAVEDLSEKHENITFELATAGSASEQVRDVEDLMIKEIDALVINPHNSSSLTPVVEEAKEQGIYVVSVDRGLTKDVEDVYVAGDNYGFGQAAAEYMADRLNGEGKILVIEGVASVINKERMNGFTTVMDEYPDIEILDSQPGDFSKQKSLTVMENFLQKYQDVDAVWAGDDDQLEGALQAYEESGRDNINFFVGGGGKKTIIKSLIDGSNTVGATVTYPPSMVATGISLAVRGVQGQSLEGFYQNKIPSEIILKSELVTEDNAEQYYHPDSVY